VVKGIGSVFVTWIPEAKAI